MYRDVARFIYWAGLAKGVGGCVLLVMLLFLNSNEVTTRSIAISTGVSSLRVLVKRRTGIRLRMTVSTGRETIFPSFASALMHNIRVISVTGPSARCLGSHREVLVARRCAMASFSSTLCCVPPVKMGVSGGRCGSGTLTLGMCSVPMSALRPSRFFNRGAIVGTPFT